MHSIKSSFAFVTQLVKTLSMEHRRRAFKNIVASVFLAILEVFSLTAIIPLLSEFTGAASYKITIGTSVEIPWAYTLVVIVIVFVAKNIIGYFVVRSQSAFVSDVYITYSRQLYQYFFHQPWIDYTQENSAETIRKIRNTPFDFTNYVLQSFLNLITDTIVCTLMMAVMAWVDYRIIIFLIGLCLPVLLFYHFFRKNVILKIDKSFRELVPKASVVLTQGVDSYAEARIYKKENFFIDQFININQTTVKQLAWLKIFTSLPNKLFETLGILSIVVIIYISKVYPGYSQAVVFIGLFFLALYRIIPAFNRMLISYSNIQSYSYSITELDEVLNKEKKHIPKANEKLSFSDSILLKNISFHYGINEKKWLLKNLNVEIQKGDFIVLQGPSGVGKTTLIHILAGLITEYEGEIQVDGKILSPQNLSSWQDKLGFVPQATVVLQGSILENIAYGVMADEVDMNQIHHVIKLAGLSDFVASLPLKLNTSVGENGLTLSGGQRQRLILARALYRNPEILLLDEVTNQLDEENKIHILSMLRGMADQGKTIIFVTHDNLAKQYASRILTLQKGELLQPNSSIIHN